MTDRTCMLCGAVFSQPCRLKSHMERKTPCVSEQKNVCKYCDKMFASKTNLYRHMRQNCKLAKTGDVERLIELTKAQNEKITQLTKMLERTVVAAVEASNTLVCNSLAMSKAAAESSNNMICNSLAVSAPMSSPTISPVSTSAPAPVPALVAPITIMQQNIVLCPWDGRYPIDVNTAQIIAAFEENSLLKAYSQLQLRQQLDRTMARPRVAELLVDLVKRSHANPSARNVFLSPYNPDKVLVHMKSGQWMVKPSHSAMRLLCDGVAAAIHRVTLSPEERQALPKEALVALSSAGFVYRDEPEVCSGMAGKKLVEHLAIMRDEAAKSGINMITVDE